MTTERERDLEALHEIAVASSGLLDPNALGRLVAARARELLGGDEATLLWWDPAAKGLRILNDTYVQPFPRVLASGEGAAGIAFERGEPVVVEDYPAWEHAVRDSLSRGLKSVVAAPLLVGSKPVGALTVSFNQPRKLLSEELRLLSLLATQVAPALEAARLHDALLQVSKELREASLATATRTALLTALIDAIGVGVVLVDREGLVAHWNKEAAQLTGISAENALGLTMNRLGEALSQRLEDHVSLQTHLEQAARSPQASSFEILVREPRREIEVSVSPATLTSEGAQVGSVIVLRDITAAKELNRAKDELIGMVSHELRTPLASLVGFAELLLSREFRDDQRKQYLETMLNEGRRLTDLTNEFLDLQRIEGGYARLDLGPADMDTLISRAVAAAGQNPQTPIEVRLAQDLPLVIADANAVHQVLINMLSNARKYSPGGGAILVEAKVSGDMVEVSIRDHGLGVPPDALPKLFGKFYRVADADRRRISGTGLGLAISRRIIESHGGHVGAESGGLGEGSRFYFTLRAAQRGAIAGDVLLVEDDSGFARLVEAELGVKGLSAVWASDAETAGKLIDQMRPRAIVLDLILPGISGQDFLARLRASHDNRVPVIVVTIQELDATETLALRTAGVVQILKKHSGAAKEAAQFVAEALTSPHSTNE